MSTRYIEDVDPARIRVSLERSKQLGSSFTAAWNVATGAVKYESGPKSLYQFMRTHFEAAYNNDETNNGRCLVPGRDTSSAVPVRDFTTNASAEPLGALPLARSHSERCKSGDGCDRLATRGRFGVIFCPYHGLELALIADALGIVPAFNNHKAAA